MLSNIGQHPTRHQLYGHLPPITKTIQVRRIRHAGHCWRSKEELISDVLQWTSAYGQAKAGRSAWTYIQQLREDTGCSHEDLPEAMNNREKWRERVRDIRVSGTTWWGWWWYILNIYIYIWILARRFISTIPTYNQEYRIRISIELIQRHGLTHKTGKKQTISCGNYADYTDGFGLIVNTPTQAECLKHSLEQAARGICLKVNSDKNIVHMF